jgi:hypothetical protein
MTHHPASEAAALLATASSAAVGWFGAQTMHFIGFLEITKEDLVGPLGALFMLVCAVIYLALRQRDYDKKEEKREERRDKMVADIALIAEGSKRAIEEMNQTKEAFTKATEQQTQALVALTESVNKCPRKQ